MSKTSIICTLRLVFLPFVLNHLLFLRLRGTFPQYHGSGMREVLRALLPCAMQMRCVCVSLDSAKSGKWVGILEIPNSSEHLPFPCLHKLHVFYHTRSLFFLLRASLLSPVFRNRPCFYCHRTSASNSNSKSMPIPKLRRGLSALELPLMSPSVRFGYVDIISAF